MSTRSACVNERTRYQSISLQYFFWSRDRNSTITNYAEIRSLIKTVHATLFSLYTVNSSIQISSNFNLKSNSFGLMAELKTWNHTHPLITVCYCAHLTTNILSKVLNIQKYSNIWIWCWAQYQMLPLNYSPERIKPLPGICQVLFHVKPKSRSTAKVWNLGSTWQIISCMWGWEERLVGMHVISQPFCELQMSKTS